MSFAPAMKILQPSMMLPDIAVQYTMATGAFELLPGGKPEVKIGSTDLVAYQKTLRVTNQTSVSQSLPNQVSSSSVVPGYTQMKTYRIATRSQYGLYDDDAASQWGYALPQALRLAARQGTAQQLRTLLLYGMVASNGEGLINTPGAETDTLPPDSQGNASYTTYDPGEMAQYLLAKIGMQKTRMLILGQATKIVVAAPMRFLNQIQYAGIVQLTSYQRPGAGTQTPQGVVVTVAGENGDEVLFVPDDTLIGKGAGGADLIIITAPTLEVPEYDNNINTNIFASLTPNQRAVNQMFCDVSAPTEISTPIADGGVTTLYTMRTTPGWNLRPEGVTLISAAYQ